MRQLIIKGSRGFLRVASCLVIASGCGGATPGASDPKALHPPASELPGTDVLRYGVSHFHGSVSFVVQTDGTAEYSESRGPEGPKRVISRATSEELQTLADVLRKNDFCALRSRRREGVPDEARPSISVRLQGLECTVEMWDGEFDDDPRAKKCLSAVEGLGRALRGRPR